MVIDMKKLRELMGSYASVVLQGNLDTEIGHIAYDSRKAQSGSLFVCIKGFHCDGHDFIHQALATGSSALLVEREVSGIPPQVTVVRVSDARSALAHVAARFYGHSEKSFILIGITGTKGKTSVAGLIWQVLDHAGVKAGMIGSNGAILGGKALPLASTTKTTPESPENHQTFHEMRKAGAECVIMEVSSHALELCRVEHCHF